MESVFLFCAVVGGTIFVLQFVLTLIGVGTDDIDFGSDVPHDIPQEVPHDLGPSDTGHHAGSVTDHGSTWLFGVISFRTVVAALAFFGLSGFTALQGGQSVPVSFGVALLAGIAAMYGVHWMMRSLYHLGEDGTERIQRAIGRRGTVYVAVPGSNSGAGKIQLKLQDRLVEYAAMTPHADRLPTGARVLVTRIISPTTVEVELVTEPAETADA